MSRQSALSPSRIGTTAIAIEAIAMTTLVLPQSPALRISWPRVGALSGTLSLHAFAFFLLLVPPAAMTLLRAPEPELVHVHLVEPPPPKLEEPQLPKPPPVVHEVRRRLPPPPERTPTPPAESPLPAQVIEAPPSVDEPARPTPDAAPTPLAYHTRTRIPYPREALHLHQQGTVVLRVLVGADGLPQQIEIEKSSGARSLDLAARDAVLHWTFQAGTVGGVRSALWARVPVTFDLQAL